MGRINQLTPTTIVTTDSVIAVDAANGGVTNKLTINTLAGGLLVIGNYATQTQLAAKQDVLTFDDAPEEDSDNPVTSGGIYNAIGSAMSNVYTKAETDNAIAQSTATVDEKLRKSVQYTSTTPIDTGIVVSGSNTLKRVSLYNTSLSMPNGSWVQVGTLGSDTWVMSINGMFRLSTDSNKAFFIGQYFNVRWDLNSGVIYAMQTYSSSTLTVSVNLSVDYF